MVLQVALRDSPRIVELQRKFFTLPSMGYWPGTVFAKELIHTEVVDEVRSGKKQSYSSGQAKASRHVHSNAAFQVDDWLCAFRREADDIRNVDQSDRVLLSVHDRQFTDFFFGQRDDGVAQAALDAER